MWIKNGYENFPYFGPFWPQKVIYLWIHNLKKSQTIIDFWTELFTW